MHRFWQQQGFIVPVVSEERYRTSVRYSFASPTSCIGPPTAHPFASKITRGNTSSVYLLPPKYNACFRYSKYVAVVEGLLVAHLRADDHRGKHADKYHRPRLPRFLTAVASVLPRANFFISVVIFCCLLLEKIHQHFCVYQTLSE